VDLTRQGGETNGALVSCPLSAPLTLAIRRYLPGSILYGGGEGSAEVVCLTRTA
jgi:hypothetical protein